MRSLIKSDARRPISRRSHRKGAAVVELAACVPVMFLLVVSSIECCGMVFLKQRVCSAAYEGSRVAVRPNSTPTQIDARAREVLDASGVVDAQIAITPSDFNQLNPGEQVTVTVTAPTASNRVISTLFLQDLSLSHSVVMLKEQ